MEIPHPFPMTQFVLDAKYNIYVVMINPYEAQGCLIAYAIIRARFILDGDDYPLLLLVSFFTEIE